MASYRYLTTNLLTNEIISELPLTGVTYGQSLNEAGSFQGHILMSDSRIIDTFGTYNPSNQFTLDYVTTPAKTGLYVERDGVIVWGGIIWSRQYDSNSQTMSFGAKEFESYLDRRRIGSTVVFASGTDQFTLIKSIVDTAQTVTGGNIGIDTSGIGTSGQGIAAVYPIFAYQKRSIFDVILELSSQYTPYGFDFAIECSYGTNNVLQRQLKLYYPRRGVSPSTNFNAPMLEFPSVMSSYSYPENGTKIVNTLYGFGPGSSEGQYIATGTSTSSLGAGYPVLEDVLSLTQIPDPNVVVARTNAEVAARSVPVVVLSASWVSASAPVEYINNSQLVTSQVPVSPQVGSFGLGDTFRIRITDTRFPSTFETLLRLRGFDVAVGDSGSAEVVSGQFVVSTY